MRVANGDSCIPALADMTPPALTISSPVNGSVSSTSQVTLSGTAGADVVSPPGVGVSHNNGPFNPATGTTAWSKTLTLTQGTNTLTVRAFDATGNMTTVSRTLVYDNQSPQVSITSPFNNSVALTSPITIRGTATDNVSVGSVNVRVNGGSWAAAGGTTAWTASVALVAGTNLIEVRAADSAGNQLIVPIQVMYANPLDSGLVGYWHLDEGSGTSAMDSSGWANIGTLNSFSGIPWVSGKIGNALSFSGIGNYINVPHATSFDVTALSIALWIKTPSSFGSIGWRNLVSKQGATRDYSFYSYSSDGVKVTALHLSSAVFGSWQINLPTAYTASTWHHVAVTISSTGYQQIYSDGVRIGSFQGTAGTAAKNYPLWIGRADNYWNGHMDEVRIYNRTLSSAEIRDLAGLVGYWKFDEGTGTTAGDSSWNGHSGNLANAPTWGTGRVGSYALSFSDGSNQYVNAGNPAILNFLDNTRAITVSAWVYPTANSGHSSDQWGIASKLAYPNSGWWLDMRNTGKMHFGTCDGTSHNVYTTTTIPLNQWSHVVGWSNGTTNKVYINGVEAGSSASGTLKDSSSNFSISTGTGYGFTGKIDDVRVYNRALSASEISAIKNGN